MCNILGHADRNQVCSKAFFAYFLHHSIYFEKYSTFLTCRWNSALVQLTFFTRTPDHLQLQKHIHQLVIVTPNPRQMLFCPSSWNNWLKQINQQSKSSSFGIWIAEIENYLQFVFFFTCMLLTFNYFLTPYFQKMIGHWIRKSNQITSRSCMHIKITHQFSYSQCVLSMASNL